MSTLSDPGPLRRLVVTGATAIAVALVLRFALGQRWFSFYGIAAVALGLLPIAAHAVLSVHRTRGWRRWPVWLSTVMTAAACLAQIGFWLMFFHGGSSGLGLGVGRSMFHDLIEVIAATIPPLLAVIWILLLLRISR